MPEPQRQFTASCPSPAFPAALEKGERGLFLRRRAKGFVAGLNANVGFVGFDNLVFATNGARVRIGGTLTKPVEKKPRGLVVRADHPLELKRTHALLAGRHQLRGENPFAERHLAPFHDGSNRHGERLAAVFAFVDARTGASAL